MPYSEKFVSHLGEASVGSAAATAALKHSTGYPMDPRVLLASLSTGGVVSAFTLSKTITGDLTRNTSIFNALDELALKSKFSENSDRPPSPDNSFSINLPLEEFNTEIPLVSILVNLFNFESLEFIIILSIIYIISYNYITTKLKKVLINIINNLGKKPIFNNKKLILDRFVKFLETGKNISDKGLKFFMFVFFVLLILIKLYMFIYLPIFIKNKNIYSLKYNSNIGDIKLLYNNKIINSTTLQGSGTNTIGVEKEIIKSIKK